MPIVAQCMDCSVRLIYFCDHVIIFCLWHHWAIRCDWPGFDGKKCDVWNRKFRNKNYFNELCFFYIVILYYLLLLFLSLNSDWVISKLTHTFRKLALAPHWAPSWTPYWGQPLCQTVKQKNYLRTWACLDMSVVTELPMCETPLNNNLQSLNSSIYKNQMQKNDFQRSTQKQGLSWGNNKRVHSEIVESENS